MVFLKVKIPSLQIIKISFAPSIVIQLFTFTAHCLKHQVCWSYRSKSASPWRDMRKMYTNTYPVAISFSDLQDSFSWSSSAWTWAVSSGEEFSMTSWPWASTRCSWISLSGNSASHLWNVQSLQLLLRILGKAEAMSDWRPCSVQDYAGSVGTS